MEKVPEREAKIMKRRLRARDLTDITHTPLRPSGPSKKKGGGGNKYTNSNAVTIRPSQAKVLICGRTLRSTTRYIELYSLLH
jgi:hypothetical protein